MKPGDVSVNGTLAAFHLLRAFERRRAKQRAPSARLSGDVVT